MKRRGRLIGAAGALLMGAALWASVGPIEIARAAERSSALPAAVAERVSPSSWLDSARDALYERGIPPNPDYFFLRAMGYDDTVVVLVSH